MIDCEIEEISIIPNKNICVTQPMRIIFRCFLYFFMFRKVRYCLGFVINLPYFKNFLFIKTSRKLIDQENATARPMRKLAMWKNDFWENEYKVEQAKLESK